MLTKIGESTVQSGAQAVVPLRPERADRLDFLTYRGAFLSMAAVQPGPSQPPQPVRLGRGYRFERLASVVGRSSVVAYQSQSGTERFISLRETSSGEFHIATTGTYPLPDLPPRSTHIISGTQATTPLPWHFIAAYNATTGSTRAYVWGTISGSLEDQRWRVAEVRVGLPAGITAMTVLNVYNHVYLAYTVGERLEIQLVSVGESPAEWSQPVMFGVDMRCSFDHWCRPGVQLGTLSDGQSRCVIFGYHPATGNVVVDRVSVFRPDDPWYAHIGSDATLTRIDNARWGTRSLVRLVDNEILRYGVNDGVAEWWHAG